MKMQSRYYGNVTTHFDLELVLMIGVVVSEVPEVLRDVETPLETLGGHEILGHLDAVVDVPNLRTQY